jgi:succinate dehydrogenase/fumarate reductase flavoprotein subunit
MTDTPDTLECDLLVIGGGMAGLSAAGYAAQRGARVILLEKATQLGGSAALSGGFVWTATSLDRLQLYAGGRRDLGEVVLRNYSVGLEWMREREIPVSRAVSVLHGRGYQVDLPSHFASCRNLIEQEDGHVVVGASVASLLMGEGGRVVGARTSDADGQVDVLARHTILATGGFQNSAELRARYIHPHAADRVLLRTNPCSDGAGMRLATAVGAATSDHNPGFYGHLVSESPRWGQPGLYTTLTQYHSDYALLLNEQGERFCDESLGDHVNTGAVLAQNNARALCFWDSRIHQAHGCTPIVKGAEVMDKMAVALEHGGRGVVAADWSELENFADAQGFAGSKLVATLRAYNEACLQGWETLSPPRAENFGAQDQAPFYGLVVVPAITHTHAGIRVDPCARVLRHDGSVIEGLLAAGVDAGDVYGIGYSGGLGLALAFGLQAAQTALSAT